MLFHSVIKTKSIRGKNVTTLYLSLFLMYSIPLVYVWILSLILLCLDYCRFIVYLEIR